MLNVSPDPYSFLQILLLEYLPVAAHCSDPVPFGVWDEQIHIPAFSPQKIFDQCKQL